MPPRTARVTVTAHAERVLDGGVTVECRSLGKRRLVDVVAERRRAAVGRAQPAPPRRRRRCGVPTVVARTEPVNTAASWGRPRRASSPAIERSIVHCVDHIPARRQWIDETPVVLGGGERVAEPGVDRRLRRAGNAGASKASIDARSGDPAAAAEDYRRLITHWRRAGMWSTQWTMLRSIAGLLARLGRLAEAAVLEGAVRATPMPATASSAPTRSRSPSSAAPPGGAGRRRLRGRAGAKAPRSTATPPSSYALRC